MKLNEANLAVWYELLKDEKNRDIANKLLIHSATSGDEKGDVSKEIKELLKLEKQAIAEAKVAIELNNKLSKKIKEYIDIFDNEKNETLKGIFTNKILNEFTLGTLSCEEEIDEYYHSLRRDYLNAEKHVDLKKEYEKSSKMDFEKYFTQIFNDTFNEDKVIKEEKEDNTKVSLTKDIEWIPLSFNSTTPTVITSTDMMPFDLSMIDFENFDYGKELDKLANEIYNKAPSNDEYKEAMLEAKLEGWIDGDEKELRKSIYELLVYLIRYERYIGIKPE